MTQGVGDLAFEITVSVELKRDVEGGLLLFYNRRLSLGMGIDGAGMKGYRGGLPMHWLEPAQAARTMHLRIVNDDQIESFY